MGKPLTQIQSDTLDFIKDYIKINKFPPTRKEIAESFGIHVNAAQLRVEALIKKGAATHRPGVLRSTLPVKGFKVVIKESI